MRLAEERLNGERPVQADAEEGLVEERRNHRLADGFRGGGLCSPRGRGCVVRDAKGAVVSTMQRCHGRLARSGPLERSMKRLDRAPSLGLSTGEPRMRMRNSARSP